MDLTQRETHEVGIRTTWKRATWKHPNVSHYAVGQWMLYVHSTHSLDEGTIVTVRKHNGGTERRRLGALAYYGPYGVLYVPGEEVQS